MNPKTDQQTDQQHLEEAERLALLPVEVQQQAIALIRAPADNPKVGKRDRQEARDRADAVERHLKRMNRQQKKLWAVKLQTAIEKGDRQATAEAKRELERLGDRVTILSPEALSGPFPACNPDERRIRGTEKRKKV